MKPTKKPRVTEDILAALNSQPSGYLRTSGIRAEWNPDGWIDVKIIHMAWESIIKCRVSISHVKVEGR